MDKNHGKSSKPRDWKKYDSFRTLERALILLLISKAIDAALNGSINDFQKIWMDAYVKLNEEYEKEADKASEFFGNIIVGFINKRIADPRRAVDYVVKNYEKYVAEWLIIEKWRRGSAGRLQTTFLRR